LGDNAAFKQFFDYLNHPRIALLSVITSVSYVP